MAARAKSTSTSAAVDEDAEEAEEAVGDADDEAVADDDEYPGGEGAESYTMPLLVASARWTLRVDDGS
jgi:hypothetical protein